MRLDRRDFLQQLAAWSAGLAAAPVFRWTSSTASAQTQPSKPMVAVAKGSDYAALVQRVLEPLGGMSAFVSSGDRVVVKPNIGWDRSPQQAANTHPQVVASLVKAALDAGAREVLVFDRPCNDPRLTYRNSGIQAALDALDDRRVVCSFIDDRRFVPVKIQRGQALDEWQFYRDALEADCYINVPIAKHHVLARLTLGLKNVMGVIGGNRGQIHHDIGQKLADLNSVVAPRLTVIDATRILLAHGPAGGNLADVKVLDTLIASKDIVAADAYATTLFDLQPQDIVATVAAARMGLGEMDLSRVNIVQA